MKHKTFNTKHNKQQESHFLLSVFHVPHFMFHEKGMAMLATVLILMLIMVAVGLSMISSGLFEGVMSENERQSQEAHLAATGGAKDATMRIARNKNFATSTGYFIPSDPSDCSLYGSTACAKVIVEKDSASVCSQSISAGQDCVISLGTLANSARKVEVILNVNATSGKMIMQSWNER